MKNLRTRRDGTHVEELHLVRLHPGPSLLSDLATRAGVAPRWYPSPGPSTRTMARDLLTDVADALGIDDQADER